MLILTRKLGETIAIGDDIIVAVVDINEPQVRLGIEAPRTVPIHREELLLRSKGDSVVASQSLEFQFET
jgi:carbon storage regulator